MQGMENLTFHCGLVNVNSTKRFRKQHPKVANTTSKEQHPKWLNPSNLTNTFQSYTCKFQWWTASQELGWNWLCHNLSSCRQVWGLGRVLPPPYPSTNSTP